MKRKYIVNIIKLIWTGVALAVALTMKDKYSLNFGIYLCIAVPILVIGDILIEKLFKGNK